MATIQIFIIGGQELPDMSWEEERITRGNPAYEADLLQAELLELVQHAVEHLKPHVKYRGDPEKMRALVRKISEAVGVDG